MTDVPEIRTDRLLLRGWRDSDRAMFAAMNADPVGMEHFPALMTDEQSNAAVDGYIDRWAQFGYGLWAVERLDTSSFIGFAGLGNATFDAWFTPAVEVGWRLSRDHWGHGFATEAGGAGLTFGFKHLRLPEILSWTAVGNAPSWRVMQRLGMTKLGEFDHPRVPVGHPVRRHVVYRITRDEWAERTAADAGTDAAASC